MKRLIGLFLPLACFLSGPVHAQPAGSSVVYNNLTADQMWPWGSTNEFGDEITLGGDPAKRTITQFDLVCWLNGKTNGNETVKVRFYDNSGPNDAPENLLYEGHPFPLRLGQQTLTLYPNATVPATFTWTVQFQGLDLDRNATAGLRFFDPPAVGSSNDDFWEKRQGVWYALWSNGHPVANFGARATATLSTIPVIMSHPRSQTKAVGQTVVFDVIAGGQPPFAYQWRFQGTNLPGATNDSCLIPQARIDNTGPYEVVIHNSAGSISSRAAMLTVLEPPAIINQSSNQTVKPGTDLLLTVTATGAPPLHYQWQLNGKNISGATNSSWMLTHLQPQDFGRYRVIVANRVGVNNGNLIRIEASAEDLPFTDTFADAHSSDALAGNGRGTNLGATPEPGEPDHAGKPGGKSVWYIWKAFTNGIATFTTQGSDFDTLLAVYTGTSISKLSPVAQDDDRGGFFTSLIQFNATAGTEYHITVDGYAGAIGNILLSWNLEATSDRLPQLSQQPQSRAVSRGDIAALQVMVSPEDVTFVYQWDFNGRPLPAATRSTLIIANFQPGNVGRYQAVVQTADGRRTAESLPAYLEMGDDSTVVTQDKFRDLFGASPASAIRLASFRQKSGFVSVAAGSLGTQILDNFGATTEPGEPHHAGVIGGASRWMAIVPDGDGFLEVDTMGSDIDTVLAVYSGTELSNVQLVAADNNGAPDGVRSRVRFPAARGTPYLIAVDGVNGSQGIIQLNWKAGVPPILAESAAKQIVPLGGAFSIQVNATGTPSPHYQWFLNGIILPDRTNAVLAFSSFQETNRGIYSVVASNVMGAVTNDVAILGLPETVRLMNWQALDRESFRFQSSGAAEPGLVIESSEDLIRWTRIFTNRSDIADFDVTDSSLSPYPLRFYRASRQP